MNQCMPPAMDSAELTTLADDTGLTPLGPITPTASRALPEEVKSHLIAGTSALATGVIIERGAGFLANVLAARFAGAATFGAYSLAISTANNISTYAAGGIGATAVRFSGKYTYGTRSYSTLARALIVVSAVSALVAAAGLWLGAGPIAHLMGKQQLTGLLRWAVLSAAAIILLECARGFFVGQRRLKALLLLSVLVGAGMITLLPLAARMGSPVRMIVFQGGISIGAVAVCLLFATPLALRSPSALEGSVTSLGPMLREVWAFGGIQLSGVIASNLAGWWLTTLVARADSSLVQMSFFAIASQWRNLAGLAPSLLTEGSYAVMARSDDSEASTPHRVFALCSFASSGFALMLSACGMIVIPWILSLLYGQAFRNAEVTVAIALAIAVVHLGNGPAAARLTIVSIRSTGVINTVWAVAVAVAGTLLLFHHGRAWQAMAIYFGAHVLSSFLVLLTLGQKDQVPEGLWSLFGLSSLGSALLAGLAMVRGSMPDRAATITGTMLIVLVAIGLAMWSLARRHRWLPSRSALLQAISKVRGRITRQVRHV